MTLNRKQAKIGKFKKLIDISEKTTAEEGEKQRIQIKELKDDQNRQRMVREQEIVGYNQTLLGLKQTEQDRKELQIEIAKL